VRPSLRPRELVTSRLLEHEALGLQLTLPRDWDIHRPAYPGSLVGVRLWPLAQRRPVAQLSVAIAGQPDSVATVMYRNRTALLALGFVPDGPAPQNERDEKAELRVLSPQRDRLVRQVYLARGHDILVVSLDALPAFAVAASQLQDRLVRALLAETSGTR
jgi:hypothetical protein